MVMAISTEQTGEIEAARSQLTQTLRPTVPALEEIMFEATPILDHGFLRVVDYMGNDDAVVQAARVYAEAMLDIVRRWVPAIYDAFLAYRLNSMSLSATATDMVRRALAGEKPSFETSGLTRREWDEVAGRLQIGWSA